MKRTRQMRSSQRAHFFQVCILGRDVTRVLVALLPITNLMCQVVPRTTHIMGGLLLTLRIKQAKFPFGLSDDDKRAPYT